MLIYVCVSAVVCFLFLVKTPMDLPKPYSITAPIIVSIALGWLVWPLVILAWIVHRRKEKSDVH